MVVNSVRSSIPLKAGLADYRREGQMALYSLIDRRRAPLDVVVGQKVPV